MIRQDVVGESVIGVDLGAGADVLHDETYQGFRFSVWGQPCSLDLDWKLGL